MKLQCHTIWKIFWILEITSSILTLQLVSAWKMNVNEPKFSCHMLCWTCQIWYYFNCIGFVCNLKNVSLRGNKINYIISPFLVENSSSIDYIELEELCTKKREFLLLSFFSTYRSIQLLSGDIACGLPCIKISEFQSCMFCPNR